MSPPAGAVTTSFRDRMYGAYASSREAEQTPRTLGDLQSRAPFLRRIIRDHLPPARTASILDIGCGHGPFLHFAREAGYTNVAGVEASSEQIAVARALGIDGVEQGDVLDYLDGATAESLDVVVALDVIEHFTRDELLILVDEVRRVLRPGGRWIIHTPNAGSPFFGMIRYGDATHEMAFTGRSLAQILRASGFLIVRSYEDTPIVHGPASAARWAVWRVIRSALRLYLTAETGSATGAILTQNFLAVATM